MPLLSQSEKIKLTKTIMKNFLFGLHERGYSHEMSADEVRALLLDDKKAWEALTAFLLAVRGLAQPNRKISWREN